MYLDRWISEAFNNVPPSFQDVLNWVSEINRYKRDRHMMFKKNDFGFEQIIISYLAQYFVSQIRISNFTFQLGISEKLNWTDSNAEYDFSLITDQCEVIDVVEVKTVTNNSFSWPKEDIKKLRNFSGGDKYLLAVSLYVSERALKSISSRIEKFVSTMGVVCQQFSGFHTCDPYEFWYFLFSVDG